MDASASEVVEAPVASVPFSLKPILVDLEGGLYIGLILLTSMDDLVTGRRSADDISDNKKLTPKVGATGGLHKCGRDMKRTCSPCPFGTGINHGPFWKGRSSPPFTVMFFVITGICAGCAGRTVSIKKSHPPTPPRGGNHHCRDTKSVSGGMSGVPEA